MSNILEISTWNQLVKAKSDYENLRIYVKQYNSEPLTGTQIIIQDYNTNDIYFSGFVTDIQSTLIPTTATISNNDMITIINNFGFNVRISEPIVLSNSVVTILKGLYEQGYRYVYKYYTKHRVCTTYDIYVSDVIEWKGHDWRFCDPVISKMPNYVVDEWEWCEAFKTYPISDLIENGTVNNGLPI